MNSGITFAEGLESRLLGSCLPLLREYAGQCCAQPAYVWLREDGQIDADYSGEIGSAVPASVWHKRDLRFQVNARVSGVALWRYLKEGQQLLQRIHAGREIVHDGCNKVGVLSADAVNAAEDLQCQLDSLELESRMSVLDYAENAPSVEDVWPIRTTLEEAALELHAHCEAFDGSTMGQGKPFGTMDDCREALLKVAENRPNSIGRWHARQLVIEGRWCLLAYAEWIVDYCEKTDDPAESALDGKLIQDIPLWIANCTASRSEIEAGVVAARAVFASRGIPATQAYLASLVDAAGGDAVDANLDAWNEAQNAAFDAAFDGWERRPEAATLSSG